MTRRAARTMHFADLLDALAGQQIQVVGNYACLTNPDELDTETWAAFLYYQPYVARYVREITGLEETLITFPNGGIP